MENLDRVKDIISRLNGLDLNRVKDLVDEQLQTEYYKKENFMLHERIDDYLYEVYYSDGRRMSFCIGQKAYKEYMENKFATTIWRKTKDLFPERELLLQKV